MKKNWIWILLIVIVVIIGVINAFFWNKDSFWTMSLSACITLVITLVFGFYFSQKNVDERNQKASLLKVMENIQRIINERDMYIFTQESDPDYFKMKKRELNNGISILEKYAKKYDIESEVKKISDLRTEYTEIVGNHIDNDKDTLSKLQKDLERPLGLMNDKLSELMVILFD